MEAVFVGTGNKARVRSPGQAIELAEDLNTAEFTLTWERFGRAKTAVYRRREGHGQWGTFSGLNGEWMPVDVNGQIARAL